MRQRETERERERERERGIEVSETRKKGLSNTIIEIAQKKRGEEKERE